MKRWLLVGLGNPVPDYAHTRHNLGARLLRAWVDHALSQVEAGTWQTVQRLPARVIKLQLDRAHVTCLLPLTPMNRSGEPVRRFVRPSLLTFWRHPPAWQLLIIHDDLDLPLGTFRLKPSGSARGHNGVRSIQQALATGAIPRLLLGIGPKPAANTAEFVLAPFSAAEEEKIASATPAVLDFITRTITE